MESSQYFSNIYSKFWMKQTHVYGFDPYCQGLVRLIQETSPRQAFEVGIGTGWPIASTLKENGITVDGCDIAESLVNQARQALNNKDGIWVGEVTQYQGEPLYDTVYCLRVSWCIPDFYSVIDKMLSMTVPGGTVIFDIMDKYSSISMKTRWSLLVNKYYNFLGVDVDTDKTLGAAYGLFWLSPGRVKRYLERRNITYRALRNKDLDYIHKNKVVFVCRKGDKA